MVDKSIEELEERVKALVKENAAKFGFPKMSDYDIDEDALNDYFFDQKIIADPMETAGDEKYLFIGLAIGALLCLLFYLLQGWRKKRKEQAYRESGAGRYVTAVLEWSSKNADTQEQ